MSQIHGTPARPKVPARRMEPFLPGTFSFSTAAVGDALVGQHFDPAARHGAGSHTSGFPVRSHPGSRRPGRMVAH